MAKTVSSTLPLFLALVAVLPARAQEQQPRTSWVADEGFQIPAGQGQDAVGGIFAATPDFDLGIPFNSIVVTWLSPGVAGTVEFHCQVPGLTSPFVPGYFSQIRDRRDEWLPLFLLTGRELGGAGFLGMLEISGPPQPDAFFRSVARYPGWDITSATWNPVEGRLYILLYDGTIWYAPFETPYTTIPPKSAFQLIPLESWEFDPLMYTVRTPRNSRRGVEVASVRGSFMNPVFEETDGVWGLGAAATYGVPPERAQFEIRPGRLPSIDGFEISRTPGPFEVWSQTEGLIASGVLEGEGWTLFEPPPGALKPGAEYWIRRPDGQGNRPFRPVFRRGEPLDGTTLRATPALVDASASMVGSPLFGAGSSFSYAKDSGFDAVTVHLWVAVRPEGVEAPVTVLPGTNIAALDADGILTITAPISDLGRVAAGFILSIPANPDLEGSMLYVQVVAEDPATPDLASTEVLGVQIRRQSAGLALLMAPLMQHDLVRAVPESTCWLPSLSPVERSLCRRLVYQMARQARE